METGPDSDDSVVHELTTGHYEYGELSDTEQYTSITDPDQSSTEQNCRETMRGVFSYMGWTHIPHIDTPTSIAEDNPFAAASRYSECDCSN